MHPSGKTRRPVHLRYIHTMDSPILYRRSSTLLSSRTRRVSRHGQQLVSVGIVQGHGDTAGVPPILSVTVEVRFSYAGSYEYHASAQLHLWYTVLEQVFVEELPQAGARSACSRGRQHPQPSGRVASARGPRVYGYSATCSSFPTFTANLTRSCAGAGSSYCSCASSRRSSTTSCAASTSSANVHCGARALA